MCCIDFFFFKQKTAYEMRISDWSSDVCSSDLRDVAFDLVPAEAGHRPFAGAAHRIGTAKIETDIDLGPGIGVIVNQQGCRLGIARSEEHTSELQSLMPNSYAVFCWQKKIYHILVLSTVGAHTTAPMRRTP